MDTLTHALSGALLARATAPQPAPDTLLLARRVLVGFLAAAPPDLDFVMGYFERGNPSTCVWFQDLRFFTPGRDQFPFRFGLCREGSGPWQPFQLVGEGSRLPVR